MSKIKRNEPCPCGSGKKYKNCHGASAATSVNPQDTNKELGQLHEELITYSLQKNESELNSQLTTFMKGIFANKQEDISHIYQAGLAIWFILNISLPETRKSFFDSFYDKNLYKMSQPGKALFQEWTNSTPSVYEVISERPSKHNLILIQDIDSKQHFAVPIQEQNDVMKGSHILGTLVPFKGYHNFFYTMIKLYHQDKDSLIDLLGRYKKENGGMKKNFPAFLAEVLQLGIDSNEWQQEAQQDVAELFAAKMVDSDYQDKYILQAMDIWKKYCEEANPNIKKPQASAAAVHYYIVKNVLPKADLTQGQLAEIYGVSAGTVSANYRKLATLLG